MAKANNDGKHDARQFLGAIGVASPAFTGLIELVLGSSTNLARYTQCGSGPAKLRSAHLDQARQWPSRQCGGKGHHSQAELPGSIGIQPLIRGGKRCQRGESSSATDKHVLDNAQCVNSLAGRVRGPRPESQPAVAVEAFEHSASKAGAEGGEPLMIHAWRRLLDGTLCLARSQHAYVLQGGPPQGAQHDTRDQSEDRREQNACWIMLKSKNVSDRKHLSDRSGRRRSDLQQVTAHEPNQKTNKQDSTNRGEP